MILSDTDHLWGIGGNQAWVWKSFCRGMNPLFMDPYLKPGGEEGADGREGQASSWTDHLMDGLVLDPKWDAIRKSLGYTRACANRMEMARTAPHDELASSRYCLANPGAEYLLYLPEGGTATVDLSDAGGMLEVEWLHPGTGETSASGTVTGGARRAFTAPFEGDAVLYLFK